MILIGTLNLTRTRDRGNFHCPGCGVTASYRLRARRPFLTLYFIPTVPVGGAEVFVQCDQCKQHWDETVLQMDRATHEEAAESQFRDEAMKACILFVIADDSISENEIEALKKVGNRVLDRPIEREELGRLCSVASENRIEAVNYVLTVCPRWNDLQCRLALQAMFLACSADGELGPAQLDALTSLKDLFGLTDADYQNAIEESLDWEAV